MASCLGTQLGDLRVTSRHKDGNVRECKPTLDDGDHQLVNRISAHAPSRRAGGIYDVAPRAFRSADAEGVSPAVAAYRPAEERMSSVGRLAAIRLPG
jgi:hypothetical protein